MKFFTYNFEDDTFPGQPSLRDWSQVKTGSENGILFCEFPNGLRIEFIDVSDYGDTYRMAMFTNRRIETDYPNLSSEPDDDYDEE